MSRDKSPEVKEHKKKKKFSQENKTPKKSPKVSPLHEKISAPGKDGTVSFYPGDELP